MWTWWRGSELGADWRGEVFAQGSIGCLNLHVTLHPRQGRWRWRWREGGTFYPFAVSTLWQRKTTVAETFACVPSWVSLEMAALELKKKEERNKKQHFSWLKNASDRDLGVSHGAFMWCPVGPQGALMWYVRENQMRESGRERESGGDRGREGEEDRCNEARLQGWTQSVSLPPFFQYPLLMKFHLDCKCSVIYHHKCVMGPWIQWHCAG